MVFGGAAQERLQFNEDSLGIGDENPSGGYDTMGGCRAFGDVHLILPGTVRPLFCCPASLLLPHSRL